MSALPDLRHVRYVALAPTPPDRAPSDIPLFTRLHRSVFFGALAGGSLSLQVTGRPLAGMALGGVFGAASVFVRQLRHLGGGERGRRFALVPWGVLLDEDDGLAAVRWCGVHSIDVRYHASRDGAVHARVTVDSVAGKLVGFASDAVDIGALAGDLESVTLASARPLAVDLAGDELSADDEPFVERILHAARNVVNAAQHVGLELHPVSYREGRSFAAADESGVARGLWQLGERSKGQGDVWALIAAIAGELRLPSFRPSLARLASSPQPRVAAMARAALGRLGRPSGEVEASPETPLEALENKPERDHAGDGDGDAINWFVAPDELERLRVWRDAQT